MVTYISPCLAFTALSAAKMPMGYAPLHPSYMSLMSQISPLTLSLSPKGEGDFSWSPGVSKVVRGTAVNAFCVLLHHVGDENSHADLYAGDENGHGLVMLNVHFVCIGYSGHEYLLRQGLENK